MWLESALTPLVPSNAYGAKRVLVTMRDGTSSVMDVPDDLNVGNNPLLIKRGFRNKGVDCVAVTLLPAEASGADVKDTADAARPATAASEGTSATATGTGAGTGTSVSHAASASGGDSDEFGHVKSFRPSKRAFTGAGKSGISIG